MCRNYGSRLATIASIFTATSFAVAAEDAQKHTIPRSSRFSVIRRAAPPTPTLDDPPGPLVSVTTDDTTVAPSDQKMSVQIPSNGMMSNEGMHHQPQLLSSGSRGVAYLSGKIKLVIAAANLASFSACVKPAAKAGLVNITAIAVEGVTIGSQLLVKTDADKKDVLVTFTLKTTEANKGNLASQLSTSSSRESLAQKINEGCDDQEMIAGGGGGTTSFACSVKAIELDGIVATPTSTHQPYLAVGGLNFVVTGNIQMRIHPKQDVEHLKVPICKGVAHSTGQPPQACQITGYENEQNTKGEEEINFAFNLTILDTDYGKVAKSIDHYQPDSITNIVRWECQHDNISPEAAAGTMAVHVVMYSCASQGKSQGGYIGIFASLVVDIGDVAQEVVGDFGNSTDNGDPVTKRYVRHAFSDALMNSTNNALDSARVVSTLSKAAGNSINFTFEYLNQESKVDADVTAISNIDKAIFDQDVVDLINQFMDGNHTVTAAAITNGYVKKITADDPRIITTEDDGSPPVCHEHGAGAGDEQQVCGTFKIDSNAADDFANDENVQMALKTTFAQYSCGDAEEMTMSIVLTADLSSSLLPKNSTPLVNNTVSLFAEHASSSVTKTKARLRRVGIDPFWWKGEEEHTSGQAVQEMIVGICVYEKPNLVHRVHFMLKHLPLDGVANYVIQQVKQIENGTFTQDEDIQFAIKSANVTAPVAAPVT